MKALKNSLIVVSALVVSGIAQAEMVVVVNAKNPAGSMTADQVADVYLGKNTSFAPVDLPESSAERGTFCASSHARSTPTSAVRIAPAE